MALDVTGDDSFPLSRSEAFSIETHGGLWAMGKVYLEVENPLEEKMIFPLDDTVTIGRSWDNTITIAEPIVSRYHAKVSFADFQVVGPSHVAGIYK